MNIVKFVETIHDLKFPPFHHTIHIFQMTSSEIAKPMYDSVWKGMLMYAEDGSVVSISFEEVYITWVPVSLMHNCVARSGTKKDFRY